MIQELLLQFILYTSEDFVVFIQAHAAIHAKAENLAFLPRRSLRPRRACIRDILCYNLSKRSLPERYKICIPSPFAGEGNFSILWYFVTRRCSRSVQIRFQTVDILLLRLYKARGEIRDLRIGVFVVI